MTCSEHPVLSAVPAPGGAVVEAAGPARRHHHVTLTILIAAGICFALLQSMVIPALPQMQLVLGSSASALSWILTANLLSGAVATPLLGRLGDMYGKGRMLVVVMCALCLGTLLSALSTGLTLMLVGRVLQGLGAGIFPLAFGIIRDEFPEATRSHGIGLMSSLFGIGGGFGLVLAGPVLEVWNYHWLFWLPLIIIVPVTIAVATLIPASPVRSGGRVNIVSAGLMTIGLVIVLMAISEATAWGPTSFRTVSLLVLGLLVLAGWIRRDSRSREPLVDMALMRRRPVWTTNAAAFLLGLGMYASFLLLPRFVQQPGSGDDGLGVSLVAAGIFLLPQTVALIIVGQFTGRIDRVIGSKVALIAGSGLVCLAFVLLLVARDQSWEIYLASAVSGVGMGLGFSAMANLVVGSVPQSQTGQATGINTVSRTVGGTLGGQVVVAILAGATGSHAQPTATGYSLAFGFCAAALLLSALVTLFVPRRRSSKSVAPQAPGLLITP